jgi:hypothetical protein
MQSDSTVSFGQNALPEYPGLDSLFFSTAYPKLETKQAAQPKPSFTTLSSFPGLSSNRGIRIGTVLRGIPGNQPGLPQKQLLQPKSETRQSWFLSKR